MPRRNRPRRVPRKRLRIVDLPTPNLTPEQAAQELVRRGLASDHILSGGRGHTPGAA